MSSEKELTTIPVAPLKLIVMESCAALGKKVDDYIVQFRKRKALNSMDTLKIPTS